MRVVESDVVRLEPQTAEHAQEMFEILGDPAIYEHENEPPPSVEWLRARFRALESRSSPDGTEHWLNWVVRQPASGLIGYVQATVAPDRDAAIAYVLNSRYWGKGLASAAVALMVVELLASYDVRTLSAVLKRANLRSRGLLERLRFSVAPEDLRRKLAVEPDELLMVRNVVPG
jgi:RimJ/RimL family protein N-acetyltransferase